MPKPKPKPKPPTPATDMMVAAGETKPPDRPRPIEDAIRSAVAARGWSGYKLARIAGVPDDPVQRFLGKKRSGLALATAEALVVALGIEVTAPAPQGDPPKGS